MDEHTVEQIAGAFRRVLSEGENGSQSNRAILIKRIPIICNDILQMKSDLKWIRWMVMGGVAGICGLAVMLLAK